MSPKRRKFERTLGKSDYRKQFVIAAEGAKTEPQYFDILKKWQPGIQCLKGNHDSSPPQVLKRMKEYFRQKKLIPPYEAWVVVDKDQWTGEQLNQLHAWAKEHDHYGFALSNPNFEYWLLLHFEDTDVASSRDCSNRLKRHLPEYDKGIDASKITRDRIDEAIRRARERDKPPCADWPRTLSGTTVYKLVENILQVRTGSIPNHPRPLGCGTPYRH